MVLWLRRRMPKLSRRYVAGSFRKGRGLCLRLSGALWLLEHGVSPNDTNPGRWLNAAISRCRRGPFWRVSTPREFITLPLTQKSCGFLGKISHKPAYPFAPVHSPPPTLPPCLRTSAFPGRPISPPIPFDNRHKGAVSVEHASFVLITSVPHLLRRSTECRREQAYIRQETHDERSI
jgi:hypothetical protein